MQDAEIIKATTQQLGKKQAKTAQSPYLWAIKDFLSWRKNEEIDGDKVLKYLDYRESQGDRHYTLKMRFYALRFLLNEVLGVEWRPKETSVFSTRERRRKPKPAVFSREEVLSIIRAVKERGDAQQKALFSISTVYGCRRSEICDLNQDDLDFNDHTITIFSRKGGREAVQLIPPQIEPYLRDYTWEPINPTVLSNIFQKTMELVFGEKKPGMGFHAIRHLLVTELNRTELDAQEIYNFMRWTEPGIMPVYAYHYKPGEIENKVFEYHPFLEAWE